MTRLTPIVLAALAGVAAGQVQHGLVIATEDGTAIPNLDTLTRQGGRGAWTVDAANSTVGNYFLDFVAGGSDAEAGILIATPAEPFRSEPSFTLAPEYSASFHIAREIDGLSFGPGNDDFLLFVRQVRRETDVNYNAAVAFFPWADGWMGALGFPAAQGPFDNTARWTTLVGNPALTLRSGVRQGPNAPEGRSGDQYLTDADPAGGPQLIDFGKGEFVFYWPGVDVRRDGILLGMGAKFDEANGVQASGTRDFYNDIIFDVNGDPIFVESYTRFVIRDNGTESGTEQDPAGFVFIPKNTPNVVMCRFSDNRTDTINNGQGSPVIDLAVGDFTLTDTGNPGQFRLEIAGRTPADGTLLFVSETGSFQFDNFVTYEADATGYTLYNIDTEDDATIFTNPQEVYVGGLMSFVWLPNDADVTPPATLPAPSFPTPTAASARFEVVEFDGAANDTVGIDVFKVGGSDRLNFAGENRGDIYVTYDNYSIEDAFGVSIPAVTEITRDNTLTGGGVGMGTANWDNSEFRGHRALDGGEFNFDFAFATFPRSQFPVQEKDIAPNDNALPEGGALSYPLTIDFPGIDEASDGILLVTGQNNSNRFATVEASAAGYTIRLYEAQSGTNSSSSLNAPGAPFSAGDISSNSRNDIAYVYVPYNSQNLVAAMVDDNGNELSGTGGYSLGITTFNDPVFGPYDVWELSIPGVDARTDGVLLVNGLGDNPVSMAWEASSTGTFLIAQLDNASALNETAAFQFAYIPYDGLAPAAAGCNGADLVAPFGQLDIFDILGFFDLFGQGDASADLAGSSPAIPGPDGVFDIFDILRFFELFGQGC